jgi:hypothetical protein
LNIFDNPTPMRRHVAKKKAEILRLISLLTPRALEITNFFDPVINAPEKEILNLSHRDSYLPQSSKEADIVPLPKHAEICKRRE